ncbi:DUF2637 domain-containing protein [Saccharothrix australiensis]|nr:DUF2637 domain-containing protein [Saccharothrix australiensis]
MRPGRARQVADGWSGPGWLVWLLATPVIGSAVVLSFAGLAELARACRIAGWLVYLWPVSLDATGVVATLIWLDRRAPTDARRAARLLALAAIALSIGGNSLWHWLVARGYQPEVWVQMAVGAVPPMVLAATLHVLQLAARRQVRPDQPTDQPDRSTGQPSDRAPGWAGRVVVTTAAPPRPSAVVELPPVVVAGLPVDPIGHPVSDPTTRPARVLAERLAVINQPNRPPTSALAGRRGAWRDLVAPARAIVTDQPGIGRHALAQALSARLGQTIPASQARKVLDHLAAITEEPSLV